MEQHYILDFLTSLYREISRKRVLACFCFSIVTISIVTIGIFWPLKYQTSATLYVDQRNVIEPLLRGQAAVPQINQAQEASEKIYTRKILEKVARDAQLINDESSSREIAFVLSMLGGESGGQRIGIQIYNSGKNYINVSYKHENPETSFNVITALINAFIRNIAESKRQESKEAYDFIESQAENYKKQLISAEESLERFNSDNKDGTESGTAERISELRIEIEELNIDIDEIRSKSITIKEQLSSEQEYLNVRTQTDIYRQRINEIQTTLDNLLLQFTDTHPDVIALKLQIDDHKQAIKDIEQRQSNGTSQSNNNDSLPLNPLYEQLRRDVVETEVELSAALNRKNTLERLLEEEYERAKRLSSRRAQLSELTRDYNVTRELYEDMLNRKEKARLSMTLEIEGQGTSYKVHEPPTFPLNPAGIKPIHFVILSPIIGLLCPIGLIGVFIFLDPRIRFPSDLSLIDNCELLTIIEPLRNRSTKTLLHKDNILSLAIITLTAIVYLSISLMFLIEA